MSKPTDHPRFVSRSSQGEPERIVASRAPKIRDGHLDTSFAGLAPGAYEVRVTGLGTGSPIAPVTAPILVWPQEPNL